MTSKRIDAADLIRWQGLEAVQVLDLLADYVKIDKTFAPTKDHDTRRVHVNAVGAEWEFLVSGPKFYDTRTRTGGGGAVDLVMHLWGVPFKKAAAVLKNAGA